MLLVVLTAAAATFLFSLLLPKRYKAEAKFFTNIAQRYSFQNTGGTDPQFEMEAQLKTIEAQLTSSQVLSLLAYRLILHDLSSQEEPFRNTEILNTAFTVSDIRYAQQFYQTRLDSLQPLVTSEGIKQSYQDILRLMRYDIKSLLENLSITRTPGSDILRIGFISRNPQLSFFAVNALCNEFNRYYEFRTIETWRNTVIFYSEEADKKRMEVKEAIAAQQDFVEIMKEDQTSAVQARELLIQLRNLEVLRSEEERRIRSLERVLRSINERITHEAPQGGIQSTYIDAISLFREQIATYHSKLINQVALGKAYEGTEDTLSRYRVRMDNQLYQFLRSSIANLQPQNERLYVLQQDRQIAQQHARGRIEQIDQHLENIREKIFTGKNRQSTVTTQNDSIQQALQTYFKVIEPLYEARYFGLNDDSQLGNFDYAQVPEEPVPSQRWLHVLIASLLSFTLCVIMLVGLEMLDATIKTGAHFERISSLPLLSSLNYLNADRLDLIALFSDTNQDAHLEAYKHLMRKIRFELIASGGKVFMLTSTRPGAGKTSLLFSLGYSLSLNQKKILLIDTHFKNNQLTRMTSAVPTLERYMADEISFDELVSPSGLEGIYVLGCEGGNYTPSEIFVPPNKFNGLLQKLGEEYDYIFLEGPALNLYSGSKELIQYVDRVIPVFSAKATIKQTDKLSIKFLKSLNGKLMGTVLNKVELEDIED